MKKITFLLLSLFVFTYGYSQQSADNISPKTNPEIGLGASIDVTPKTTAPTFEPEMTTAVVEPVSESITKTTKPSFKERVMTKYITRQMKKADVTGNKPKVEKTNTIALISGIAGIFSLISLFVGSSLIATIGLLAAIAAIIMGFVGKGQINDGNGSGKGWAITGIVGGILYFFVILLIVALIGAALGSLGGM